jgi:hypothetical protein
MRRPVLSPVPVKIISSSTKSVASNSDVGAVEPLAQVGVHGGGARDVEQPAVAAGDLDADIGPGLRGERGIVVLEIERHLAGDGKQLDPKVAWQRKRLVARDDLARHHVAGEHPEDRIGVERGKRFGGGKHGEILAFAQDEEAGDLIDLGAGQDDGGDRRVACAGARLQRRRRLHLGAQIGRSIE